MVSFEDDESIFTDDPDRPFRTDAPISKRFQEYVLGWLTGEGVSQGVTWHSRFELNHETLSYFRAKAMTLLNEHLLTRRLEKLGYPVVDIGWLASQLAAADTEEVDWHLPWRDQLKNRGLRGVSDVRPSAH